MRANHVDPFLGKEDRGEFGEREKKRRKGRNVFGALDREALSFTSFSSRKREENAIVEDCVPSMPIQFNRKKVIVFTNIIRQKTLSIHVKLAILTFLEQTHAKLMKPSFARIQLAQWQDCTAINSGGRSMKINGVNLASADASWLLFLHRNLIATKKELDLSSMVVYFTPFYLRKRDTFPLLLYRNLFMSYFL